MLGRGPLLRGVLPSEASASEDSSAVLRRLCSPGPPTARQSVHRRPGAGHSAQALRHVAGPRGSTSGT